VRRRLAVVAALLALIVTAGASQSPARTVWVQVIVTDKNDRVVTSLGPDDFSILADEEPRDITVFSKNELPMALALLFDVSGSMRKQLAPSRQASRLLIDEFVRGDRVNIVAFDSHVLVSNGFVANRARIAASIDLPMTGANAPCTPPNDKRPLGSRSEGLTSMSGGGTAMWDAVWCGVSELQRDSESIRKVMVIITDGMENSSRAKTDGVIRRTQAAGALVYTVGFLGIEGRLVRNDGLLREFTQETGGRHFPLEDKDPVAPVFKRIGEELRGHYVLGFTPRSSGSSGKLAVRVKPAGLTARTRSRY
jgi:Ca-activated chloride channel homolog